MDHRAQREIDIRQENLQREIEADNERATRERDNLAAIAEGERQRAEEERRKLNADPSIAAALLRADKAAKAEERRVAEEEQRRNAEARAELEREKDRRRLIWMTHGGDPDSFERAWPDLRNKILTEKQDRLDQQMQQSGVF